MNLYNKIYDKCFYINLERSVSRKEYMEKTLNENNIIFERITAIDGNSIKENIENPYNYYKKYWNKYALGLNKTFLNIMEKAKASNYDNILVFEDDIVFENNFNENLTNFFNQLPNDWGVVQLAVGSFRKKKEINYINTNVVRVEGTRGTFGMLINKSFYTIIIDFIKSELMPLDDIFINIQNKFKKSFAFYPGLIRPLDGIKSEITGIECNYSIQFNYIYPELVKKVIEEKNLN